MIGAGIARDKVLVLRRAQSCCLEEHQEIRDDPRSAWRSCRRDSPGQPAKHESRGNGGGLRPSVWLRLRAAAGGNWTPDGTLQLEGERSSPGSRAMALGHSGSAFGRRGCDAGTCRECGNARLALETTLMTVPPRARTLVDGELIREYPSGIRPPSMPGTIAIGHSLCAAWCASNSWGDRVVVSAVG
jgi:hypothetical protein